MYWRCLLTWTLEVCWGFFVGLRMLTWQQVLGRLVWPNYILNVWINPGSRYGLQLITFKCHHVKATIKPLNQHFSTKYGRNENAGVITMVQLLLLCSAGASQCEVQCRRQGGQESPSQGADSFATRFFAVLFLILSSYPSYSPTRSKFSLRHWNQMFSTSFTVYMKRISTRI